MGQALLRLNAQRAVPVLAARLVILDAVTPDPLESTFAGFIVGKKNDATANNIVRTSPAVNLRFACSSSCNRFSRSFADSPSGIVRRCVAKSEAFAASANLASLTASSQASGFTPESPKGNSVPPSPGCGSYTKACRHDAQRILRPGSTS